MSSDEATQLPELKGGLINLPNGSERVLDADEEVWAWREHSGTSDSDQVMSSRSPDISTIHFTIG